IIHVKYMRLPQSSYMSSTCGFPSHHTCQVHAASPVIIHVKYMRLPQSSYMSSTCGFPSHHTCQVHAASLTCPTRIEQVVGSPNKT
ncbi:hypothetical protein BgiBS90_017002, partial [Biomphalaria glabrata]